MRNFVRYVHSPVLSYSLPVAAILLITAAFFPISESVNSTTVAFFFLITILVFATFFGRNPALLASFVGMLCFNYFFLHPVGTWFIADPQNLIAWASFTITAIIAGELSSYARRRAREAERLYAELQEAFEKAASAEAMRQSEKLKSSLLDAVTHDLRTPLTSIKAAVTTLLDSEGGHRTIELDSSGRTEFLEIIDEETDRLNRFIEGMVDLARIESGSAGAAGSVANVNEAIASALERAGTIGAAHVTKVLCDPELPLVRADGRAVAEVIYNLYENAVKYSPEGSEITIEARRNNEQVEISVNDQGKGIPPELRERVFEKFVRVDKSAAGMGLGLAIVRGIVEAHDGTVEIRNGNGGKGTKVVVKLLTA